MTGELNSINFPTGTFKNGEFLITFTEDEKFSIKSSGKTRVEGVYEVFDDKIILTDKAGEIACLEPDTSIGEYTWKFTDNQLSFSKIRDLCKGRIKSLTSQPLIP